MNLTDRLSCTRRASWSDKKAHRNRLGPLLEARSIDGIKKAYLLGYAPANSEAIARIGSCVERKSAWCLRKLFQELAWGEDELGLTVAEPMCGVYLLIEPNNRTSVAAIGNPNPTPSLQVLLLFADVTGFPYWLIFGKRLIVE